MVLGKLPVPGRPSNLADSRARAYCTCSGAVFFFFFFWTFLPPSIFSLLFLPLFGRRSDIDGNIVSKDRLTQNNQPTIFSRYPSNADHC